MVSLQQIVCCVAAVSAASVPSALAEGYTNQAFLAQYAQTVQEVIKADDKLYGYMTFVSRLLDRFYKYEGRLPSTPEEQARFKETAAKVLKENPYHPQIMDLWEQRPVQSDNPVPIVFLPNTGLTKSIIADAMKSTPESWRGEPGTIYIMTNSTSLYIVYGISADRMPMRSFKTGGLPMRAISHDCSEKSTAVAAKDAAAK